MHRAPMCQCEKKEKPKKKKRHTLPVKEGGGLVLPRLAAR